MELATWACSKAFGESLRCLGRVHCESREGGFIRRLNCSGETMQPIEKNVNKRARQRPVPGVKNRQNTRAWVSCGGSHHACNSMGAGTWCDPGAWGMFRCSAGWAQVASLPSPSSMEQNRLKAVVECTLPPWLVMLGARLEHHERPRSALGAHRKIRRRPARARPARVRPHLRGGTA